jgi:hypothetical protein
MVTQAPDLTLSKSNSRNGMNALYHRSIITKGSLVIFFETDILSNYKFINKWRVSEWIAHSVLSPPRRSYSRYYIISLAENKIFLAHF